MVQLLSRKEAIKKGLTRYFTGKPCSHGHFSERLVSNMGCQECAAIKRRKYAKDNPEWKREQARKWNARYPELHKRNATRWRNNNLERVMWNNAKRRAEAKGLSFDIEIKDIFIPEFCPLLGLKMKIGEGGPKWHSPSLDRIDSGKGYIKGNIWVISSRANSLKGDGKLEEFELIVKNWPRQGDGDGA